MPVNTEKYKEILAEVKARNAELVAVSKIQQVSDIIAMYDLGQRDFGENYVQELVDKAGKLPPDIRWHFIGHLQTNKVKYIAGIVQLIQGVDSLKLLKEINKESAKISKVTDVLLQVHIAKEETKYGFDAKMLEEVIKEVPALKNIRVTGLMGMASFVDDMEQVRQEFRALKEMFTSSKAILPSITQLSMGMSADYKIALEEGSTMVRIGSMLFGFREARAS